LNILIIFAADIQIIIDMTEYIKRKNASPQGVKDEMQVR